MNYNHNLAILQHFSLKISPEDVIQSATSSPQFWRSDFGNSQRTTSWRPGNEVTEVLWRHEETQPMEAVPLGGSLFLGSWGMMEV